ncbi:Mitochondrial distribution and morphology protein 35 [Coemansia sp. RSA 989]|nr:Mitochondrial distribution and morphology protein 35 [Coemansia sp. RSA 989]
MTGEQYAYNGSPQTTAEQYPGQRQAHPGISAPPQTAGASASASAARNYNALLNTHRHPHSTTHGHYIPSSGPVPPPPPLPQHYAAGSVPRRLSNAPSDPSDKVHAGPVRAGPANNSSDDTSEDEIESLRRAMGSDSRTVQRQLLRKEQQRQPQQASSEVPSSPATQDTAPSAAGMMSAAPGPAAIPAQPGYSADISPAQQQPIYTSAGATSSGMYGYPAKSLAQQPPPQPAYTQAHYSHYPPRPYPQQQHPPMASAYPAATTNPFVHATMAGTSAAHPVPTLAYATAVSREYAASGSAAESALHATLHWPSGGYPAVSGVAAEGSARQESASVRSNDQMSGTVTDASGYSQAHWPHATAHYTAPSAGGVSAMASGDGYLRTTQHQSPTLVQAQSPLCTSTHSPTEPNKSSIDYSNASPAERERMQRIAGAFNTAANAAAAPRGTVHVTEPGSMGAYQGGSDMGQHNADAAAGPQAYTARVSYGYSSTAKAPMQEMQQHHPGSSMPPMTASESASAVPAHTGAVQAEASTAASQIAIQSLLNSPEDQIEKHRFPGSEQNSQAGPGSDAGGSGSSAIRQHIAKENARFRRQSGASGHAPLQPPAPQQPAVPMEEQKQQRAWMPPAPMANNDSSPNSASSYHSAGYSMWHGRADTIMDYATAKQSFSSNDETSGSAQHRNSSYFTDAPVPGIPATFSVASPRSDTVEATEAMRAFEATMSSSPGGVSHIAASSSEVPTSSMGYGYFKHPISKPASVLVQVGDNSLSSIDDNSESQMTSMPPANYAPKASSATDAANDRPSEHVPENPFASDKPTRKATNESLDNVLEYYRTNSDMPVEVVEAKPDDRISPFDLPPHPNHRKAHGSSLVSLQRLQTSPLYQRTSLSSPVDKPQSGQRAADVAQWPLRHNDSDADVESSSDDSVLPNYSPIAFDFARRVQPADSSVLGMQMRSQMKPAQDMQQKPLPAAPLRDVYSMLDDLSEPEDLELPPASTSISPQNPPSNGQSRRMYPEIPTSEEDSMLQMESIDGFEGLSDIIDMDTVQDSEYGYSNSNDSTDSFGEPIEHEAGLLPKDLLDSMPPMRKDELRNTRMDGSMTQLADEFSRAGISPMDIHQTDLTSQRRDYTRSSALMSGRTNTSTLTTSSTGNTEPFAASADGGPSANAASTDNAGAAWARDKHASTAGGTSATLPATSGVIQSTAGKAVINDLPLDIMEYAGELELALAREQEDYYTDNDPTLPTLDPSILQNLGRAVHQQCLLQRQQLQRRKSNMQLGLGTAPGANQAHEDAPSANLEATLVEPVYADHEEALRAMLAEVSQYFTQSGLSLVFPFSAKWVGWLTRHPDRPFPWRKDPDEELVRNSLRDDDDGEFSEVQSEVSSFGGEPPVLSRPVPPEDVLSVAMIPMSKRRPARVTDFVTQEKRKGINAHWQYYSVINQITTVASTIHRRLMLPREEADHTPVAHELAALYQFLGGDFKKYKERIEKVFDTIKQSLGVHTPPSSTHVQPPASPADNFRQLLSVEHVEMLREMMASIIIDALYSMNRVAASKEHPPPNTPTGAARPRQQDHAAREPFSYAISTLKGLPTQPIIRYLTKEMRVVNGERRRRGLAHSLSRNNSMGHLRHPQYMYQVAPPVPPLPHQQSTAVVAEPENIRNHSGGKHQDPLLDSAVAAMLRPTAASASTIHEKFLKGEKTNDCEQLFKAYQACLKTALHEKGLDKMIDDARPSIGSPFTGQKS